MKAVLLLASTLVALGALGRLPAAPPKAGESPPKEEAAAGSAFDAAGYDMLARLRALRDIAARGKDAAAAGDELLRALDSPHEPLRQGAVTGLTEAGEAILPPLVRRLPELSPAGARAALNVFINLRSNATPEVAAAVWGLARSPDEQTARAAGDALARLGPRTAVLAPQLVVAALDDAEAMSDAAHAARRALRNLGAEFYRALPPLAARLRRPISAEMQLNVDDLMRPEYPQSPPEEERTIVETLAELAEHPSAAVHRHAMSRLAGLGAKAAAAAAALERIARDDGKEGRRRYLAVRCLAKIAGGRGIATIASLHDAKSPAVRGAVIVGLAELGPSAPEARQALETLAADEIEEVRKLSRRVLDGQYRQDAPPEEPARKPPAAGANGSPAGGSPADHAAKLEATVYRFMAPETAALPPSRARLADELTTMARLLIDGQRMRMALNTALDGPETGYFLAWLDGLRRDVFYYDLLPAPPPDHWTRLFQQDIVMVGDGEAYELDPFRPRLTPRNELGEVPDAMDDAGASQNRNELLNHTLQVLRKFEPELATRLERNLIPEVADVLFAEHMQFGSYGIYPVLDRKIPAPETVPAVNDRGRACADFLKRFVREAVPAYRVKKIFETEFEIRAKAFDELHRRVLGETLEEMSERRLDSTDVEPLRAWRDLVREFRPDRSSDILDMILQLTSEEVDRNQRKARDHLADVYRAQRTLRERDVDANGTADYWTADVSGLSRLMVDGKPIGLLEESVAALDARPLAGEPAAVPKAPAGEETEKPGYLLAAVRFDAEGRQLAEKGDDPKTGGRNTDRFAVCAYPRTYGRTGRQTYLITEDGRIRFKDTEGKPVERLPRSFDDEDWTPREEPVEGAPAEAAPVDGLPADGAETTPGVSAALLMHPDPTVAIIAARRLAERAEGETAEDVRRRLREALPQMTEALRRPSWPLRLLLARSLAQLERQAAEAVPGLIEALSPIEATPASPDGDGRAEAVTAIVDALAAAGVKNAEVRRALEPILRSDSRVERLAGVWAWAALDLPQPDFKTHDVVDPKSLRFVTLRSLLTDDLHSVLSVPTANAPGDVERAALVAAWLDPPAEELQFALWTGLTEAAAKWKYHPAADRMAEAMIFAGGETKLLGELTDMCEWVLFEGSGPGGIQPTHEFAVRRLGASFPDRPQAVAALVRAMRARAPYGESEAIELFGAAFASSGDEGRRALVELVNEPPQLFIAGVGVPPRKPYRRIAIGVLAKVGRDDPDMEPLARRILADSYAGDLAVELLLSSKNDATADLLEDALGRLKDETGELAEYERLFVCESLVRMGREFAPYGDFYEALLKGTRAVDAVHSLRRIGKPAAAFAPRLREAARGEGAARSDDREYGFYVRAVAARALWSVAGDRETPLEAATILLGADGATDRTTRVEAVRILADLGPQAAAEAPRLVRILRESAAAGDPDEGFVVAAVDALEAMGPATREALEGLARDFELEHELLHVAAARALKRLSATEGKPAADRRTSGASP